MSLRSKKNKRGARGSVEEEERATKKTNMAESGEQVETEPNLLEIKSLLLQIQNTVLMLVTDNQSLKQELSELKASIIANKRTTDKLKEQLTKAENANVNLVQELERTKKRLDDKTEEIYRLEECTMSSNSTHEKTLWR